MLQNHCGFNNGVVGVSPRSRLVAVRPNGTSKTADVPTLSSRAWPDLATRRAELKAQYVLRLDALDRLEGVLEEAQATALVVKGAALASLYPRPWDRPMADVDLLVRPSELAPIRAVLERRGFTSLSPPDRPYTEAALEVQVTTPSSVAPLLVEMHLGLDKVFVRRVDLEGLFARARPLEGRTRLLGPSLEDHVLLVALHLAADEFRHLPGFVDLEILLGSGVNLDAVVRRAHEWRAETPCYVALRTLDVLAPGRVPPTLLGELAPSVARALLVSMVFDVGSFPVARAPSELGWRWLARQTVLRDDTGDWVLGVASYGARRLLDRVQSR